MITPDRFVSERGDESVDLSNPELVAWAFRKLSNAKSRIAEERATADALLARLHEEMSDVEDHFLSVTEHDEKFVAYLENQLTQHLLNARAADPECKSIRTPWGEVSSRVQEPEFKRDETALLEWADNYRTLDVENFVRTKTSVGVDWEGIKAHCHVNGDHLVTPEGEVVPGVTVVERGPKVTVKVQP